MAHTISVLNKNQVKLYHTGVLEDITGTKIDLGIIFEG
ncbi:hypothetical protein GMMP1_1400008 [Candidatus Magnetomoraceae bacterium gMMP-1]